jgi:hypothetical protein
MAVGKYGHGNILGYSFPGRNWRKKNKMIFLNRFKNDKQRLTKSVFI